MRNDLGCAGNVVWDSDAIPQPESEVARCLSGTGEGLLASVIPRTSFKELRNSVTPYTVVMRPRTQGLLLPAPNKSEPTPTLSTLISSDNNF